VKRQFNEPELMGATEAAETLGVRQTNLRVLRGLPEPYQILAGGSFWRASEIRELAYQRSQRKKEPSDTTTTTTNEESMA